MSSVRIGVITAAHGIRGQVKIRSFAEPPDSITQYKLTDESGKRSFIVKLHGGAAPLFIASIEGIGDRNAAELLKGTTLHAPLDALPGQAQQRHRLIGLAARRENGQDYGTIIAVHNFGAGDIIEIELPGGQTEMLPLNENFVEKIDTRAGYVVVHPPEYIENK